MVAANVRYRAKAAVQFTHQRELVRTSVARALQCQLGRNFNRLAAQRLRSVEFALRENNLDEALREVDRAWRNHPDHADILAPVYGRLLALEQRDHDATLRLLLRTHAPDSDDAALIIHTLVQLRRSSEAKEHLKATLSRHCVGADSLLAHVATELLHHEDMLAPGWIGIGPNLEFVGTLAAEEPTHALSLRVNGGPEFSQPLRSSKADPEHRFSFEFSQISPGDFLHVERRGDPLSGSPLRIPDDFGLDGRATANERAVTGWVRMGWLPSQPVKLSVEDESGSRQFITTSDASRPGFRWPFAFNLQSLNIQGRRISISAMAPDGRWLPLPDTPLLFEKAVALSGRHPARLRKWTPPSSTARQPIQRAPPVDIIIPVYRGLRETLACIEAALATAERARVIVVDDATEDTELAEALDALEEAGRITLLRNSINLGFVGSVNRALAHNRSHDVVLLNSDALVFGDWLDRLRAAAYRHPKVGTVTPFSNSGTIATYPGADFSELSVEEAERLHALAITYNANLSPPIPVGVGFCLFVRRDCLREVGELDASVFDKGYGEETDFCLRASRRGWSHRLAADVFVYHAGGLSFGARRAALIDRSQRLINLRHPGYDRLIADFIAKDPLNPARRRLDEHRLLAHEGTFVLVVTLALSGGVQRFVAERCAAIRAQGCIPLLLRPLKPGDPKRCELWTDALGAPNLSYSIPSDMDALDTLLRRLRIRDVEVQHFLHLDPRVIDLVRALDVPYDVTIHDYAWICPRVTLIDGSGRYCGEPAIAACESCIRKNGSHLGIKSISVAALRQRSATWLRDARRVTAPSTDTALRLNKYFSVPIDVEGHTASLAPPPIQDSMPSNHDAQGTVRIAVVGAIGEHKGYRVLLNCARDAKRRRLPLQFIVIGYTEDDSLLLDTKRVFITGRYSEGEALHLLRREKPDAVFLPSVWPETWCYALDEALTAGLPVVAFELGAIAERLRETELGVMLPPGLRPRHINDRLLEFASRRNKPYQLDAVTSGILEPNNMKNVVDAVADKEGAQGDAMSASVQVLPLPSGLYLFSVKSASSAPPLPGQQLRLPAMHVGLGPGVRSDQVEFIAGPSTEGAWLFAQDDMLVTKVSGPGATLILTSVRAPRGEVLSIKVERLENRSEPAIPVAQAAMPVPKATAPVVPIKKSKTEAASNSPTSGPLPLSIGAHIRARGDMTFANVPWAGRVAPGLWIESFSIKPMERFAPQDIEYKGLTGSGFETPWLSDDKPCGTKGMSVPLVGFAVRLKPSSQAAAYDCEYSGYFKSGITVGPLRNGAPCRSTMANDPLEGLQVTIFKRQGAGKSASVPNNRAAKLSHGTGSKPIQGVGPGPSFGRYRDIGETKPTNGGPLNGKTSHSDGEGKQLKTTPAAKPRIQGNRKPNGALATAQRAARRS